MKSQMPVNCLDRVLCYGTCTDVAGVLGRTDQVLVCPEFKKHEGKPFKTDVSYNSQLSKTWDAKSTKLCIQKMPRNLHRHISTKYIAVDQIKYIITLLIFL